MIIEGTGMWMVMNSKGNQIFYFPNYERIAQFLGVKVEDVKKAYHEGTDIRGFCIDKRMPVAGDKTEYEEFE